MDTGTPAPTPTAPAGSPAPAPVAVRRPATQSYPFVPTEIVDDTIVFADGHRRAVLECSGANVDALDMEQKRALHVAYHAFLLGLAFPVQILICADPVDLSPYAARRTERLAGCSLAVRRLGSADTAYMRRAIARLGALDRHVYVVIPADAPPVLPVPDGAGLLALVRYRRRLAATGRACRGMGMHDEEEADRLLAERCDAVREALARAGVHAWRLGTPALQELYYRRLCPRTARLQPLDRGHVAPLATAQVRLDQPASDRANEEEDHA